MPDHIINRLTVSAVTQRLFEHIASFVETEARAFDFERIIPMPEDLDIFGPRGELGYDMRYERLEYLCQHYCTPDSTYSPLLGVSESLFESVRLTSKEWWKIGCPEPLEPKKRLSKEDRLLLSGRYPLYNSEPHMEYPSLYIGYMITQNRLLYGYPSWWDWRGRHWGTPWNAFQPSLLDEGFGWIFETAYNRPEPIVRALSKNFPDPLFTLRYADEVYGVNCGEVTYQDGNETHIYLPEERTSVAAKFAERLWCGAIEP